MTVPGVDVADRRDVHRRRSATSAASPPRASSSPTSGWTQGPPVRQRAGPPRPDLQARRRRRPATCSSRRPGSAMRTPGPLRAFCERVRARRGAQIAAVAVARKLAVLSWHMLTREEDYAFARPASTRKKLRRLELTAGARAPARPPRRTAARHTPPSAERERELAASRPSTPTGGWSATGKPTGRRRVRARHRGAHLKGPRRAKPRGRPQAPDGLRFSSSVTRTQPDSRKGARASSRLDFHP